MINFLLIHLKRNSYRPNSGGQTEGPVYDDNCLCQNKDLSGKESEHTMLLFIRFDTMSINTIALISLPDVNLYTEN